MCAIQFRDSLNSIANTPPPPTELANKQSEKKVVRLAWNENTMGFSPLVEQAIQQATASLFQYPDVHSTRLRLKLAEKGQFRPEQLIFGNGSFELLSLVAGACLSTGEEALIPTPSFSWYKVATLAAGGVPVEIRLKDHKINLDDLKQNLTSSTRIVWLCNPNNPTGTYFTASELEGFLIDIPDTVAVVLDEAYYEYVESSDYPDTVKLIDRYPNLIILRTFSKVYGLAGLRVGYGIAAADTIAVLNRIRQPANINTVAEAAAAASLDDQNFVASVLANNRTGKQFLYQSFRELGLRYIPTETNFVMVDLQRDSSVVFKELLKQGVHVRPGSDFDMPTWLRITIGKPDENEQFVQKLREALAVQV